MGARLEKSVRFSTKKSLSIYSLPIPAGSLAAAFLEFLSAVALAGVIASGFAEG